MAFRIEGLTFGDFSSLTAEEYTELFGTGSSKDLHGTYLELPWDEEENLQSVLRATQQAAATQLYGAQQAAPAVQNQQVNQHQNQQPAAQHQPSAVQQQEATQPAAQHQQSVVQQQEATQSQQGSQHQQVIANQASAQNQQVVQQHHVTQNQQGVQQQQHVQQIQQPSLHQQERQQYQQQQQQQQYLLQQQQLPPQQQVQQLNFLQQPIDVAVHQQQQPQYVLNQPTVPVNTNIATHPTLDKNRHQNQNNDVAAQLQANSQAYHQPCVQGPPPPVAVQADLYSDKPEEGAQSSDGGNTEDLSGDGKRRRNKKRRDPNYYQNFYKNPALYGQHGCRHAENAYYADNESSSGSSGNTSEVPNNSQEVPDTTVIDMTGWEQAMNQGPPEAMQSANVHMQQQQAVNRTSGMHHGYVAPQPTYNQDGATLIMNEHAQAAAASPALVPGHAPPPGLQHSAAAAAAAAIQLQKSHQQPSVMPATSNVQQPVLPSGQRTTQPVPSQVMSNRPATGDAVHASQSAVEVTPKKVDNVATTDRVNSSTPMVMQQQQQQRMLNQDAISMPIQSNIVNIPPTTATVSTLPAAPASTHTPVASADSDEAANVQVLLNASSSPNASSSASATPGSSTPIASPMSTPVPSSPQPPAVSSPPEHTVSAPDSETLQAAAAEAGAEATPQDESGPVSPPDVKSLTISATVGEDKPTSPGAPAPVAPAPAAVPEPAPAPKPTSWASLFKSSSSAASPTVISTPYENSTNDMMRLNDQPSKSPVAAVDDTRAKEIAGILSSVPLSYRNAFLRPRGLTNTGNWCYINSILQCLVATPPLVNLLRALPIRSKQQKEEEATSTPMLNALVAFINQFALVPPKVREKGREIRPGPSFEPTMIYRMLSVVNISLAVKQGHQEDAEEFLSCLLNGLHEEMLAVLGAAQTKKSNALPANTNGPAGGDVFINNKHLDGNHIDNAKAVAEEGDDDDEWEQVGPKNKSSVTRGAHFTQTPLSRIFGGQMRSALHQQGSRESATLQPFFTLQLDIQDEKIWSVRDALDSLGLRESLQGFTCNKTKMEVEASRRITLEELPQVLIMHLKCFVYDKTGGCQKLIKKLDYNLDLEISKDLLSPSLKTHASVAQRSFRLMAVVYHVGKEASGGHYITDYFHSGLGQWMRMDDSNVRFMKANQVVKPQSSLTPYLLFYRRNDCLSQMA